MERGGVRGQCETASSISVLPRLQKQEQAVSVWVPVRSGFGVIVNEAQPQC